MRLDMNLETVQRRTGLIEDGGKDSIVGGGCGLIVLDDEGFLNQGNRFATDDGTALEQIGLLWTCIVLHDFDTWSGTF